MSTFHLTLLARPGRCQALAAKSGSITETEKREVVPEVRPGSVFVLGYMPRGQLQRLGDVRQYH